MVLIRIHFSEPPNAIHALMVMSAQQLIPSPRSAQLVNIELELKPPARTVMPVTCAIRVPLPVRLQSQDVPMVWYVPQQDIARASAQQEIITLTAAALPQGIVPRVLQAITAQSAPKSNSIVHRDTIARLRQSKPYHVMPATIIQPMEAQVVQHQAHANNVL